MFDKNRIEILLNRIEESINLINSKGKNIKKPDDFLIDQEGMFILSGICMQLIFIGESVKIIDHKSSEQYLSRYSSIPWTEIMGLRDIIAHEYHRIDEEEIFNVIKVNIPELSVVIKQMKEDLDHYTSSIL